MTTKEQPSLSTSRVGKRPVDLPKGVTVTLTPSKVDIKGPKGTLSRPIPEDVKVKKDGETLLVDASAAGRGAARMQGLVRALLSNMVIGVTKGYEKKLELHGTGYRAEVKGKQIVCSLGFSHQKTFDIPQGLDVDIPKDSKGQRITLTGCNKEVVGQSAATIRSFRPPQPYGGKGVRYAGERVREKAGKAGK